MRASLNLSCFHRGILDIQIRAQKPENGRRYDIFAVENICVRLGSLIGTDLRVSDMIAVNIAAGSSASAAIPKRKSQ